MKDLNKNLNYLRNEFLSTLMQKCFEALNLDNPRMSPGTYGPIPGPNGPIPGPNGHNV